MVFKSSQYTEENEKTDQWGTPEEMDSVFAGTCELVQNAISFIQRQRRWPMYDRLPIDNWSKGRITLTGDAAHPMLQYLAQGACKALEDAAYLSDMLHKHGNDIEQAFLEYQEERIPRTANVQTSARMWGKSSTIRPMQAFCSEIRSLQVARIKISNSSMNFMVIIKRP